MRFASIPFALALSTAAVAGAQQTTAPKTAAPQPSAPPTIVFPLPQPTTPPVGRDLYRLPDGQPFRSPPLAPVTSSGGAYFGPIYTTPEPAPATTPRRASPAPPVFGMLRFDNTPASAQIFVDSYYSGRLGDIDDQRTLTLAAGPHRIELRAQDYEPVTFDVRIDPNDTIVYRAALEPVRPAAPVEPRPAGPTRIYVIPGCFAGNMAPRADRLPAGCDVKRVRVIDPQKQP